MNAKGWYALIIVFESAASCTMRILRITHSREENPKLESLVLCKSSERINKTRTQDKLTASSLRPRENDRDNLTRHSDYYERCNSFSGTAQTACVPALISPVLCISEPLRPEIRSSMAMIPWLYLLLARRVTPNLNKIHGNGSKAAEMKPKVLKAQAPVRPWNTAKSFAVSFARC